MDMKKFREKSLAAFGLARPESSETFKYQTFFEDYETKENQADITEDIGLKISEVPRGVIVKPVSQIDASIMKRFDVDDKFVQMNNAFFDSGFIIEVPKGMKASINLSSLVTSDKFVKGVIISREGSEVTVTKESSSGSEEKTTISEDILLIAEPESKMTFSEIQNYNKLCDCFSNKLAVCAKDATIRLNIGLFGGRRIRSRTYNSMEGEGSNIENVEVVFGDGEQKMDCYSELTHIGKSSTGKSLSKGVFKDKSESVFKGMIKIREGAKNASSYLSCHNMLLSKTAKSEAVPSLEIETNDVKATHSTSVSPIEEEKIFYMKSRGIDESVARKMITFGFLEPAIRRIESEDMRAKMRYVIDKKWNGEESGSFNEKELEEFRHRDSIERSEAFEGHYKYR